MSFQEKQRPLGSEPKNPFKETPQSGVMVQFVFIPLRPDPRTVIPVVEDATLQTFSQKPDAKNLFLLNASFLRGFGYDHFWKWFKTEGSYFDGYLQHGKTNADGEENPYTEKELRLMREHCEWLEQISYQLKDNTKDEVFFMSSLRMLDRIAAQRQFQLMLEPFGDAQIKGFVKKGIRILKDNKTQGVNEDEAMQSVDNYLKVIEEERTSEYRQLASLYRLRSAPFESFFNEVIQNTVRSGLEARIVVPKETVQQTGFQKIEVAGESLRYLDPIFAPSTVNSYEDQFIRKFIMDENASLTKEEVLRIAVSNIISYVMEEFSLASLLPRVPEIVTNAPIKELEDLLASGLQAGDEQDTEIILDYVGSKTSGMPIGKLFSAMRELRPYFQDELGKLDKKPR